MKKIYTLYTLLVLASIVLPLCLKAQPGGDFGDPDAMVPIDGGLSLLLAAGVAYGVKKSRSKISRK